MIRQFIGQYRFLSNFYVSPIRCQSKIYPTAEHLYQAFKTRSQEEREQIRLAATPGIAKLRGRKVTLRNDWEKVKDEVMLAVVRLKFVQNPKLKVHLLATEYNLLVEGNYWHDNYWGSCLCSKCKDVRGRNQLGITLMEVRDEIRRHTI